MIHFFVSISINSPPIISYRSSECIRIIRLFKLTGFFCCSGGRFKKEIVVDGQSYLLLIRDEGGPPEAQVGSAATNTMCFPYRGCSDSQC